jgi:hypothetical protein
MLHYLGGWPHPLKLKVKVSKGSYSKVTVPPLPGNTALGHSVLVVPNVGRTDSTVGF